MPVKRNSLGEPVEEPTIAPDQPYAWQSDDKTDFVSDPTLPSDPDGVARDADDDQTRVFRAVSDGEQLRESESDAMDDPPVGWLVIVDGPGKGNVARLRCGVNSIGRNPENLVVLDYGDRLISRGEHAVIIYDPNERVFHIHRGMRGRNLTYVNRQAIVDAARLEPLAHIQMGGTTLRFVPLCGEHFTWEIQGVQDES